MTREFNRTTTAAIIIIGFAFLGYFGASSLPSFWTDAETSGLAMLLVSGLLLPGSVPLLHSFSKRKKSTEGWLILGTGATAEKLYREIQTARDGSEFRGFISTGDPEAVLQETTAGTHVLHYSKLREFVQERDIARIVVAGDWEKQDHELARTLLECKLQGLDIEHPVESYERVNRKIWLEALPPSWLIYSAGFQPSTWYMGAKRVMDLLVAITMLIVLAPLMALVAIAIKLESAGPALFRQARVGLDGKEFIVYKFRSMRLDAELASGPVWAAKEDPRVTRLGAIIRKYRIDELPQLFNVIRGDMSMVGPRPERQYFINILKQHIPYYDLRHSVKPGMTGWAQVRYSYGASVEDAYEKLQYDLYYAKHMSFTLDLYILLKTVEVVLFGKGR